VDDESVAYAACGRSAIRDAAGDGMLDAELLINAICSGINWWLAMKSKQNLMKRIMENGKAVIIPMDHGVSEGPIQGLEDICSMVKEVEKYATAVILHKGMVKALTKRPACGLILHGSASTRVALDPNFKAQVATPREAVGMKCHGFSLHINIGGSEREPEMLVALGKAAEECDLLGLPLLAMMYPRGKNITKVSPDDIALVARVGAELGADIVKCPYTGDTASFKRVVSGCPVPVVIAGGAKADSDRGILEAVAGAMDAGAMGVSLGRNVFQHRNPGKMVHAVREIVINNAGVKDALEILNEAK
jgi:predicted phospho-2-dehydro-3-deoxyheptonate aldolase